jgi:hypothetical protein
MKIKKFAAVFMLALTVITACTAAPMAAYAHNSYSYEDAAEAYADDIEALVENTGDAYEKLTESYPENPNPSAYVQTAVDYGKSFLSSLGKLTGGFLGRGK